MSTALIPITELERMAQAVAAFVAQAEGLHPATAARDYHVIQGKPALKADAMLARYLNTGGKVEWHEHTDAKVSATFSHPNGGSLRIEWDMARAKMAGLDGKDNWKKWPRQMLRARVISEGIRATNPAVNAGIYTPEEVQDFEPADRGRGRKAKDMGTAVVVPPEGASRDEILDDLCARSGVKKLTVLVRAGVKAADEMPPEDWIAAVNALNDKIKELAEKAAA